MTEPEFVEYVEVLATGFGGRGPGGMAWRVFRGLPSGRIWRVDFTVTDNKPDPQLTELSDWPGGHELRHL